MWLIKTEEDLGNVFEEKSIVAIGWNLKSLSDNSEFEIKEKLRENNNSTKGLKQVLDFVQNISIGDYVVTPLTDEIILVGKVTSDYFNNQDIISVKDNYNIIRNVEWIGKFNKYMLTKGRRDTFDINKYVIKLNDDLKEQIFLILNETDYSLLDDCVEVLKNYPTKKAVNDNLFRRKMRFNMVYHLKDFLFNTTHNLKDYEVKFQTGSGGWRNNPYLSIRNENITTSFQDGLLVNIWIDFEKNLINIAITHGDNKTKIKNIPNYNKNITDNIGFPKNFNKIGEFAIADINITNFDDEHAFNNYLTTAIEYYQTAVSFLTNSTVEKESNINEMVDEFEESYDGMGDPVDDDKTNYWLYSPGESAFKWDVFYKKGLMGIGWNDMGDLTQYESKKTIVKKLQDISEPDSTYRNDALALWQFCNEIKPGDIIFAKKGLHEIIGYGIVESNYFYDENIDNNYYHMRRVNWKEKGNWDIDHNLIVKTLTNITNYPDLVKNINAFFDSSPENKEVIVDYPIYTLDDFLNEAFITKEFYDKLTYQLKHKKNIIIQGAPGVGKTFISKRLAYSMIGFKNKDRVSLVQFHQSYSYEDFIMGYRPSGDGFKLKNGVFYDFCKKARDDEDNDYFFIIDEINRGNLSKIFGELFMLLEHDKRGRKNKIQLLYNDEFFYIPENVYIIGMMNTADRSLAMLDYALRRRFSFFELKPAFESKNFQEYANELNDIQFNKIIELIKELNEDIKEDESLGKGFVIGHSYFTNLNKDNIEYQLYNIIEFEIIPLLEEYWFDEEEKVEDWSNRLRSVLDDSNK